VSADAVRDSSAMLALTPADLAEIAPLSPRLAAGYLERHRILPIRKVDERLLLATWSTADAIDVQAIDDLRLLLEVGEIEVVTWSEEPLRQAIRRAYAPDTTARGVIAGMGDGPLGDTSHGELALDDLVSMANEAPVVKLVNLLLLEALDARASDLHLESSAGGVSTRYRVDGVLVDAPAPPAHLAAALVSRLKIMAELDIAERRVPQDGRIRLRLRDRQVDVRVSIVPTLDGESVVLRLLDKEQGRVSFGSLGMPTRIAESFEGIVRRPHGIVLATGPTGSGKTTTLYAAIELVRTGREKILTVEDPVEYELRGVAQVPVNEKVGVTFASALRALLRQDPDVLMVGEIRDGETAEIAIQASLTGHLVLSTLHTNDAAGALTRLLDLGVPPFLVASTVEGVLAQRLVRRLCDSCRGNGCRECTSTGYRGRVGVYELLEMTDAIRAAVSARASAQEVLRIARSEGMRTLAEHGAELVAAGVTTAEEVGRVTRE
jgi:type II secretory ATPase GspE/PulE/Tfp pilus assembly ATPase PilB-like protein